VNPAAAAALMIESSTLGRKGNRMPSVTLPSIAAALALASLLLCGANPALAQTPPAAQQGAPQPPPQPAPPRPYKKVPATLAAPLNDPSLEAFRKQLADIAQRKDRTALAALVVGNGFFWERESGNGADEKKSGLDNFAAASGLDAKDGSGWEFLADYAAEPTASPVGDRKDLVCSPANPVFKEEEFIAIVKSTDTSPGEWGFPLKDGVEARETAAADSKVVEKLGAHFVRVMPDNAPPDEAASKLRIVTPAGKVAFVPAEALSPLGIDQLCYVKEAGGWKIAGYVGEGAGPQ
jgi:hypothetical protein